MSTCTYCGSDLSSYDPVYVERASADMDGERGRDGQFCNYACLSAHIDEEGLTEDACCRIEL